MCICMYCNNGKSTKTPMPVMIGKLTFCVLFFKCTLNTFFNLVEQPSLCDLNSPLLLIKITDMTYLKKKNQTHIFFVDKEVTEENKGK